MLFYSRPNAAHYGVQNIWVCYKSKQLHHTTPSSSQVSGMDTPEKMFDGKVFPYHIRKLLKTLEGEIVIHDFEILNKSCSKIFSERKIIFKSPRETFGNACPLKFQKFSIFSNTKPLAAVALTYRSCLGR